MGTMARGERSRCGWRWPVLACLLALLLASCGAEQATRPATPTALRVTPFALALQDTQRQSKPFSAAGYLFADADGVRLLDGLSFAAGEQPRPITDPERQIWLAGEPPAAIQSLLRSVGDTRYALVIGRGRLEGPGHYGPTGDYRYHLAEPDIQPLAPLEATVANLLDDQASYADRVVRINGTALFSGASALLADKVSPGGVPESGARQVKLAISNNDPALLARLNAAPGAAFRYGQVQVEGLWHGRQLIPFSIVPIQSP